VPRGRRRKIEGEPYDVPLTVSREELQGILDLIAKRFRETGVEYTKQDLLREALRILLIREGLLNSLGQLENPALLPGPTDSSGPPKLDK
jgi:hypothetical protein